MTWKTNKEKPGNEKETGKKSKKKGSERQIIK